MAITLAQQFGGGATVTGQTTCSPAITPSNSGDLLLLIVTWSSSGSGTNDSIAINTNSGTWSGGTNVANTAPNGCSFSAYLPNCGGGALSWTATFTPGTGNTALGWTWNILEFSGIATSSPLDLAMVYKTNTSQTAWTTTAASGTTISTDLLVALYGGHSSNTLTFTANASGSLPSSGWANTTQVVAGLGGSGNCHNIGSYVVPGATETSPVCVITCSASVTYEGFLWTFLAGATAITAAVAPSAAVAATNAETVALTAALTASASVSAQNGGSITASLTSSASVAATDAETVALTAAVTASASVSATLPPAFVGNAKVGVNLGTGGWRPWHGFCLDPQCAMIPAGSTAPDGSTSSTVWSNQDAQFDAELQACVNLGIGWVRTGVFWAQIERSAGVYDWTLYDYIIGKIRSYGLRFLPAVWGTPLYVASDPTQPPTSTETTNFFTAFATRYQADLAGVIEVWNEPDGGHYWNGTIAQFTTDVLIPAYSAIKAVNSSIKVLLSPGTYESSFWSTVNSNGGINSFDIAGIHDYANIAFSATQGFPALASEMTSLGRSGIPLWCGEEGATQSSNTASDSSHTAQLTADIPPLLAGTAPYAMMCWYCLDDSAPWVCGSGGDGTIAFYGIANCATDTNGSLTSANYNTLATGVTAKASYTYLQGILTNLQLTAAVSPSASVAAANAEKAALTAAVIGAAAVAATGPAPSGVLTAAITATSAVAASGPAPTTSLTAAVVSSATVAVAGPSPTTQLTAAITVSAAAAAMSAEQVGVTAAVVAAAVVLAPNVEIQPLTAGLTAAAVVAASGPTNGVATLITAAIVASAAVAAANSEQVALTAQSSASATVNATPTLVYLYLLTAAIVAFAHVHGTAYQAAAPFLGKPTLPMGTLPATPMTGGGIVPMGTLPNVPCLPL